MRRMRFLPLFKFTSRARATSWMIALCTMFIVASFSVVAGLQSSMDMLMENFEEEYFMATVPGSAGPETFARSVVASVVPDASVGLFAFATAEPSGASLTVFSIVDEDGTLDESFHVEGNETLAGTSLDLDGQITVTVADSMSVTVVGEFSSSMFPPSWMLCSHELVTSLAGADITEANFAILRTPSAGQKATLESMGFVVQPMASVLEFLGSGVEEIRTDALWVLAPSSFVIAVLAYSFLGAEMADKKREVGVLKMLGASKVRILGYSLGNALMITAYGAALGLALGIVLSYGIATTASHVFEAVFVVEIHESVLAIAFAATVAAGLVGTLVPAIKSMSSSPADDLREVRRF